MFRFILILLLVLPSIARAGSWSTYTLVESNAIDARVYTSKVALWSDHCYYKGILIDLPAGGAQTTNDYSSSLFENFCKQNQLAFYGAYANPQVTVTMSSIIDHALTNAAILSGHYEITNAPRMLFGISAGGSAMKIGETNPVPWITFNAGSGSGTLAPHYITNSIFTNLIQSPTIFEAVAVDSAGVTNSIVSYVLTNRPYGFLGAYAIKEKGLHAQGTNIYWIPEMVSMIYAMTNRIPTNQCVLNGKQTWSLYNETNGWLLHPYDFSTASVWSITNWSASVFGGIGYTNCCWVQNEAVATCLRAWGSWNVPITIINPTAGDDTTPQTFAPGASVAVKVDMKGMAGAWTNLMIKDCAYNPPQIVWQETNGTTTNWSKSDFAQGVHFLIAEAATNGVTRASLPIMFSVNVTNTECAPCMDGWVYMSPSGASTNLGTRASPYGIEAITNANNKVKSGGALIVMNGTYDNASTNFWTLNLAGNVASPTYVVGDDTSYGNTNRAHPRFLSQLNQTGSNIVVGNILLANTNRTSGFASDPGYTGWFINSPYSTNYDCWTRSIWGDGIEFYNGATNSFMSFCAAYDCWFWDTVQLRCRGHNFYVQGRAAKSLDSCVSANSGDIGFHVYGQSQAINNITMTNCISYDSGLTASNNTLTVELLFGGFIPATNANIQSCWFFQSTNFTGSGNELGYSTHEQHDGIVQNNEWLWGNNAGRPTFTIESGVWTNHLDFQTNNIYSLDYVFQWFTNTTAGNSVHTVDNNAYYSRQRAGVANGYNISGSSYTTFQVWTNTSLLDLHSTYSTNFPVVNNVKVRKDPFLANACQVAIVNWGNSNNVAVDISGSVVSGTNINVWTYQDLFGSPVLSQAYSGGSILIPKSSMIDNFFGVYYVEAAQVTNSVTTTYTNTIDSAVSSSVSITVSPNDNNGNGNGTTSFTRVYNSGTSVSLIAPATSGGNNFNQWNKDGAFYSLNTTISATIDGIHTWTAVYVVPPVVSSGAATSIKRSLNSPF